MIRAADVKAALTGERVLDSYAVKYKRSGDELRLRWCPACRQSHGREAVAVNAATGEWCHFAGACRGDALDLVAALAGLDVERDFARVLERGAELAGLADGGGANAEAIERAIAERKAYDERVLRERAERTARMPAVWASLATRSDVGERYLAGRGIDPAALRELGRDVVRFHASGEIAVALRDLGTGAIAGVQYRAPRAKGFRSESGSQADGSALVGRLAELDGGVDVAIVCEGLADTLAACLAWPSCSVFGSPGAGRMPAIAAAVAPRVRDARGRLLLVCDDDETGTDNAADALAAATAAGLVLDRDLLVIELGDHHDLADAWRAGWRPAELT